MICRHQNECCILLSTNSLIVNMKLVFQVKLVPSPSLCFSHVHPCCLDESPLNPPRKQACFLGFNLSHTCRHTSSSLLYNISTQTILQILNGFNKEMIGLLVIVFFLELQAFKYFLTFQSCLPSIQEISAHQVWMGFDKAKNSQCL